MERPSGRAGRIIGSSLNVDSPRIVAALSITTTPWVSSSERTTPRRKGISIMSSPENTSDKKYLTAEELTDEVSSRVAEMADLIKSSPVALRRAIESGEETVRMADHATREAMLHALVFTTVGSMNVFAAMMLGPGVVGVLCSILSVGLIAYAGSRAEQWARAARVRDEVKEHLRVLKRSE